MIDLYVFIGSVAVLVIGIVLDYRGVIKANAPIKTIWRKDLKR